MNRLLPLSCAILAGASCGRFDPRPGSDKDESSDNADATENAGPAAEGTRFSFTATYQPRPIDVIIIRDGQSHQDPIGRRLDAAAPVLSARLWNLGNVHVGVFDHNFRDDNPNDDQVPPANGAPIIGQLLTDQPFLAADQNSAEAFGDALEERLAIAGTRGGTPMPASSLLSVADAVQAGSLSGLFRPDAFWAVLYVGATDNPPDPFDAQDVLGRLGSHPNGFAVSALTPEKTGCQFQGLQDVRETNPNDDPQRNLEIKLQEATKGVFGSVCLKTYALFMDDFTQFGTGTAYFPVTLPVAVKPETIRIFGPGQVEVKEFRYVPNTTNLEVSTKIEPGEAFEVLAVPLVPFADAYVGTDPGDDVPGASEDELPPEQRAFLQTVQPVLARNCGGCHAGRPFSVNYASATMYKDEIARRVQLPNDDAQKMPQGSTLSPADLQVILDWTAP